MTCFNHKKTYGIGICSSCGKNLCEDCFELFNKKVICKSETCKDEIAKIDYINARNAVVYGFGKKKRFPFFSFIYMVFGLVIGTYGYIFTEDQAVALVFLILGLFLFFIGGSLFYRALKFRLNIL